MRTSPLVNPSLAALLVSVVLHASVGVPVLSGWEPLAGAHAAVALDHEDGEPQDGEQPIEELENVPFRVSLYVEAPPPAVAEAPPAAPVEPPAPVPAEAPVEASPQVAEAAPPEPPAEKALGEPAVAEAAPAEPAAEPELSEADKAALAAMEKGEGGPTGDDEGEEAGAEAGQGDKPDAKKARSMRRARTARNRRPPCPEPVEDIARVADRHWYIDRDLIEHYATNIPELQKLGSVWTHRGPDGKLNGFRVGLARCSVLRQGGLRSGDIVHDINGRRINSVLQAVAAYIALRNEPELRLNITRRGEPMVLEYTIEQPERKRGKKQKRKTQTASR